MTLIPENMDPQKREERAERYDKIAAMIENNDEWYMEHEIEPSDIVEALYFAADQLRAMAPTPAEAEPPKGKPDAIS